MKPNLRSFIRWLAVEKVTHNGYQLSAVPGFLVRLPRAVADSCFVAEDNVLS
jgi:hypothetical protein